MTNQDWMRDASLKNIDPSKLDFLQKLVFEMNSLSDKEKLPFLLALANRARKEEVRRMDMMLQKFKSGTGK